MLVQLCLFLFIIGISAQNTPTERAKKMLAQMTQDEKIARVCGTNGPYVGNVPANTRLGIPALKLNDGPQGFRNDGYPGSSTQWPSCLTLAASFDPSLFNKWGVAMGKEFAGKGANVQLGPGVNVARVPVNGRNFEYLSGEDPVLGSQNVRALVTGIQSQGVIANAKHYIHNNQEKDRGSVSANVDERTRMEIYMPPFAAASEAGLLSIMCSYNKINSTYSCENDETLNVELKGYVGFNGWVMSDWGATHSTVASANGGLDQQLPDNYYFGNPLKAAIAAGQVPQSRLDDMVLRQLTALYAIGEFDHPVSGSLNNDVTSPENNMLARTLAAHSITVLKNKNNLLPLIKTGLKNVAVFNTPASTSVISGGGGSGYVQPKYQVSLLTGIAMALQKERPCVWDAPNFDYLQDNNPSAHATDATDCCTQCGQRFDCNAWTYYQNQCWFKPDNSGRTPSQGRQSGTIPANNSTVIQYYYGTDENKAAMIAASANVAICMMATSSSEGSDRSNLELPADQVSICNAVGKAQKTIAVAITPGAVLTPWADNVDAVIIAFMPGQEEGNAIADVIFGDINPDGKLPVTFPNVENEVGFKVDEYPGVNLQEYYREGLNVGYRWYATHNVTPRFPFGFGLSYTTFTLSELSITGRNVSVLLKNTGTRNGAEVVQIYLGFPASAGEPPLQLKGFQKVFLNSGNSERITFNLSDKDLSIWDVSTHSWKVVSGTFTVYVGTSSQDLPLKQTTNFSLLGNYLA